MINYCSKTLTLALLCLIFSNQVKAQITDRNNEGLSMGSQSIFYKSPANGVDYKFIINLPESYTTSPERTYPVCYVLDGQWSFINVTSGYYDVKWDGFLPEMIIVGLSYGGENPDYGQLRSKDMTPVPMPGNENTGGAAEYVEILRNEIIPLIDKEFRTNKKDRSLIGTSYGGLFTHYVLFNAPELFNGYVIINPSLWYDNELPFRYEAAFAEKNDALNARVYMVSGEHDAVITFNKMVDQIKSHNYHGLELDSRILDDMGHSGSKSEGHARGLTFVYKRQPVAMKAEDLAPYTGKYEVQPGMVVDVVVEDGMLLVRGVPGQAPPRIFADANGDFSVDGSYLDFQWQKDESGKISGINMTRPGGGKMEIKKVE